MTQKDPGGDVIEDIEGERLISLIEESGSMAVYFCKLYLELFFLNIQISSNRGSVSWMKIHAMSSLIPTLVTLVSILLHLFPPFR